MDSLIQNFINGNLTDSKKQAKRYTMRQLRDCLINDYFFSFKKAQLTAEYLKTGLGYQLACDAE